MQTNIKSLIKNARNASRDVLRSEKVSNLLGFIATVKAKIQALDTNREAIIERQNTEKEFETKVLARAKHKLTVAQETNNPDLETFEKAYEKVKNCYDEYLNTVEVQNVRELEDYDKTAAKLKKSFEEKLAEYEEKIENWNNGTSKVSKETMQSMALDMIKSRIGASFNQGHYDNAEAELNEEEAAQEASPEETS